MVGPRRLGRMWRTQANCTPSGARLFRPFPPCRNVKGESANERCAPATNRWKMPYRFRQPAARGALTLAHSGKSTAYLVPKRLVSATCSLKPNLANRWFQQLDIGRTEYTMIGSWTLLRRGIQQDHNSGLLDLIRTNYGFQQLKFLPRAIEYLWAIILRSFGNRNMRSQRIYYSRCYFLLLTTTFLFELIGFFLRIEIRKLFLKRIPVENRELNTHFYRIVINIIGHYFETTLYTS